MFMDIFAQPNLYIVDVKVTMKTPIIKKGQPTYKSESRTFIKHPALLNDGDFPSETYKNKWIRRYWDMTDDKFQKAIFVVEFDNMKFSSKINYDFIDF